MVGCTNFELFISKWQRLHFVIRFRFKVPNQQVRGDFIFCSPYPDSYRNRISPKDGLPLKLEMDVSSGILFEDDSKIGGPDDENDLERYAEPEVTNSFAVISSFLEIDAFLGCVNIGR